MASAETQKVGANAAAAPTFYGDCFTASGTSGTVLREKKDRIKTV